MITINDFNNPFGAILEFEKEVAKFTGAPYCVTTDCCTHALEIVFRLRPIQYTEFPARTYLSVPMLMHKLSIDYQLIDQAWTGKYQFKNTNVWDAARAFSKNMYEPNTIQCISFGRTKPLEVGRGGCILTDDYDLYYSASKMRYDGRDVFKYSPWADQEEFTIGYHYYMRPEECIIGLEKLRSNNFTEQLEKFYNYPDCRKLTINRNVTQR